jgi:hypothetical protein
MFLNDPGIYMRMRGYPPTIILECAVCPARFQAKDGLAFPATAKGQTVMAAFCCAACYLTAMPIEKLWRA